MEPVLTRAIVTARFSDPIDSDFPERWRTTNDLVEGLLLAAALELQFRRRLSPHQPFDPAIQHLIPAHFNWDTFGCLITHEERLGKLALLALVWEFTTEALHETRHLRNGGAKEGYGPALGYQMALEQLAGTQLGKYGNALFTASFAREWYKGADTALTQEELDFLENHNLPGVGGGILMPTGPLYVESIWTIIWRILERRSPELFINHLAHRRDDVLDVLTRGAALAQKLAADPWTNRYGCFWPGWPGKG